MNDAAMKSPVIILYWQLLNKFIMLMKLREMLVRSWRSENVSQYLYKIT